MMEVKIVRKNKEISIPKYETAGAVAFDFVVSCDTTINSGEVKYLPTGIIIKVPKGLFLAVVARSSTLRKRGLLVPFGVIDNDYCGPEDEIFIQAYNITKEIVKIKKGDRIAQGLLISIEKAKFVESNINIKNKSRGSGSTG